ncbi:hypothetical protein HI113_34185 [Corallococcus exiguus]|uniref:hypothetical protein n=1 Tax=Corallococcus exiguus TaxID=83462 RepID=UPI0014730D0F|nr:hypothetical protein [Corallococcus exiguus]NNB98955.1 hypothetical protein [Corallococcus exiguus]
MPERRTSTSACDIVWLVEAWPGGQSPLAATIRLSPVHDDPVFQHALVALGHEFADLDAAGARMYARFMSAPGVDLDQSARRASSAVKLLLAELAPARL